MAQNKVMEFEYKAEMKQLLHLIVHSLYTHPEVFLRELVSNSSDALNKVRFLRLTNQEISSPESELTIHITADKDKELFSIHDTGIGMTYNELIEQIGTIASSGTLGFLQKMKEEKNTMDGEFIGKFGVGFYSVFMVTDEITIETKHADVNSLGYRWKSSGEEKFTIEEIDLTERGTKIFFKLKDEYKEFYEPWKIKSILQKYSNFVDFPIFVNDEKVNVVSSLWHRKKEDLKEDEVNEFYKFITNDYEPPLGWLHLAIEGNINFKALLFVPQTAPVMLFRDVFDKSVQLYSSKIFIQDDCKELIPEYLRFIRGVVDTEDLPLNVSREVTQSSPLLAKMRSIITSKILTMLEEWFSNDYSKYVKFYQNFGSLFKTGLTSDFSNKDKITELILFESSKKPKGEFTNLKEYVSKLKEDQSDIYYVIGENRETIDRNPNLEYFRSKDIEVLFLTDPIDAFIIPYIIEYDKKQLKSIDKADIKLDKDAISQVDKLNHDLAKTLLDVFKQTLGDKVEDVRESSRLVESPVTLVVGSKGLDPQVEKMMRMMGQEIPESKKILEVNTSHKLIRNLAKLVIADPQDSLLRNCIMQLYDGAVLIDGQLKQPVDYVQRMNEIMIEATK